MSYSKRAHTLRTAVGNFQTTRARLGSPSLVDFHINSPVPAGFVAELIAKNRPARIECGLRHFSFCKFGGAYVANDDKDIRACYLCCGYMKMMPACIYNFCANGANAIFLSSPSGLRECHLVLTIAVMCEDGFSAAHDSKSFDSQVDSNFAAGRRWRVANFALKYNVPSTSSIPDKASGCEFLGWDGPRHPELEFPFKVDSRVPLDLQGAGNEWNPPKRPSRAAAGPEAGASVMRVARGGELTADCINCVGVNAKHSRAASAEGIEFKSGQPRRSFSGLPSRLCLSMRLTAKIPDLITSPSVLIQVFFSDCILDAVLISEHHWAGLRSGASARGQGFAGQSRCQGGHALYSSLRPKNQARAIYA